MNKLLLLALLPTALLLFACEKNPVCEEPAGSHPSMRYTDLKNAEVTYGTYHRVDVDGDGTTDFSFSTLLVGDPLLQHDRLQFYADSKVESYLPVNEAEQVPMLAQGDSVKVQHTGYTWYEISDIVLAEKIMPVGGRSYWGGMWKDAAHMYLPIMIRRSGQRYYGWIELSMDAPAERLVLHRAALSREAGKEVKAGY